MSLLRRNVSFQSRCQSTSPYPCRTCRELLRSRSAYSYPCRARDGRRLPLLKWSRNHTDVSQRLSTHDVLDVLRLLETYHEDDSFHHQRIFRQVFDSVTPCHFVVVFWECVLYLVVTDFSLADTIFVSAYCAYGGTSLVSVWAVVFSFPATVFFSYSFSALTSVVTTIILSSFEFRLDFSTATSCLISSSSSWYFFRLWRLLCQYPLYQFVNEYFSFRRFSTWRYRRVINWSF